MVYNYLIAMDIDPSEPLTLMQRIRLRMRGIFVASAESDWQKLMSDHAESGNGENTLTEHEKGLISAALQMDEITAEEVSIPRSDIEFVNLNDDLKAVAAEFVRTRKSRLLVCGEDLDDVRGVIGNKDILACLAKAESFNLTELMRPPTFIPTTQTVDRVLQLLKKKRSPLAIVVDEYGGTAGLVSLKDILEVLVGELADEDNVQDFMPPKPVGNGVFRLDPKMPLEDVKKLLKMPHFIEPEDVETIGGLVLQHVGAVPATGEVVIISPLKLTITKATPRRIEELDIVVLPDEEA